jgi:hypothetical protein
MKTFTDYFHDNDREYHYTVKLACDNMSEECVDKMEQALRSLDLVGFGTFSGSPLQENPLDFPNLRNTSVQTADFAVKYPSSTDALERKIAEALGYQRCCVVVYTENDPRKTYTKEFLERRSPAYAEYYEPALANPDYPVTEEETQAQEDYPNQAEKMMDVLAAQRKDRKLRYHTNTLVPEQKVENADSAGQDMGPMGETSPFTPETRS